MSSKMRRIGYLGTLNKIMQPTNWLLITTLLTNALIIKLQLVFVIKDTITASTITTLNISLLL